VEVREERGEATARTRREEQLLETKAEEGARDLTLGVHGRCYRAAPPSEELQSTPLTPSDITNTLVSRLLSTHRLSTERIKSSIALKEWGASEGPDLNVRLHTPRPCFLLAYS